MDLNLITIARRASLGPHIVKRFQLTLSQLESIVGQYERIFESGIFNETELQLNRMHAFIGAVSLAEQYLFSLHYSILSAYPRKLGKDKFDLEEIMEEGGLLPALLRRAEKKALDTAYSSFSKQIKTICDALEIKKEVANDRVEIVNEIKCSRDVYVHSPDAKVNWLYLQKAGAKSREREGAVLKISEDYFKQSIEAIRLLLQNIVDEIPDNFKLSNKVNVFKEMWANTCLNKRVKFSQVWDTHGVAISAKEAFLGNFAFSHSEVVVYDLFRFIYSGSEEYRPDIAYYLSRWGAQSKEAQILYSWLDCQFYF